MATQQSFSDAQEVPTLYVDTTVTSQRSTPPEQPELNPTPLFTQPPEDPPENLNPDPVVMMTNLPPNGGGALCGTPPSIFDGTRSRSDIFWSKFQHYCLLN